MKQRDSAGGDERHFLSSPLPGPHLDDTHPVQKQIRLHEARTRLLAEPGDIAGAGFAVGYDSPSQFSREYRRMFGAPPSRDALTLPQTTPPLPA